MKQHNSFQNLLYNKCFLNGKTGEFLKNCVTPKTSNNPENSFLHYKNNFLHYTKTENNYFKIVMIFHNIAVFLSNKWHFCKDICQKHC